MELSTIIKSDVPAAFEAEVLKKRTRIGIARKPPPTPNRPVIVPIIKDMESNHSSGTFFSVPITGLISIEVAAIMSTKAKPDLINSLLKLLRLREKPTFVTVPIALIMIASFTSTSLLLNFGINPEVAAEITMARAAVVALGAVKLKRKIRMGTESIAPPAPTNPRTEPMKTPLRRAPNISMWEIMT